MNENGLEKAGVRFLAPGDLTQESDLPALGESAVGILTTFHYAISHDSAENKKFVEAAHKAIGNPAELSFPSVGATAPSSWSAAASPGRERRPNSRPSRRWSKNCSASAVCTEISCRNSTPMVSRCDFRE